MDGIKFLQTVDGRILEVCTEFYFNYLKDEESYNKLKSFISKITF